MVRPVTADLICFRAHIIDDLQEALPTCNQLEYDWGTTL